jgi:ATP synthase protein I
MNQFGRSAGYLALFSEIGLVLFVTTLMGAGGGIWLDGQLGTKPLFVVVGFLGGAAIGAIGIYRLIVRFLERFEESDR